MGRDYEDIDTVPHSLVAEPPAVVFIAYPNSYRECNHGYLNRPTRTEIDQPVCDRVDSIMKVMASYHARPALGLALFAVLVLKEKHVIPFLRFNAGCASQFPSSQTL